MVSKAVYAKIVQFTLESMLELSREMPEYNLQADIEHYYRSKIKPDGILLEDEFKYILDRVMEGKQ